MYKGEKSILNEIYIVAMLMFISLFLSMGRMDMGPIFLGTVSCILIAYGYFIIRRFFPEGDKLLFIIPSFLAQFGLVMIYRVNPQRAIKQLLWFTLGMGVYIFFVVFLPNIKKLDTLKYVDAIACIALLLLPLLLGSEIKGSRNWIRIGRMSMQPSEIAKLFLILYLSSSIRKIEGFMDVAKSSIPVFISIGLLVIEKDLGAALIFFGIFITMLYIGTSNIRYILIGTGTFSVCGILSYFAFYHVRTRVYIWLDPWKYKNGRGHQICQSLIAIASGGLVGTGIGRGYPYLIPEVHNDFIFAAICEEMGLLGGIAVVFLYLILVYRGLRTALYARDTFSMLVAVGIASMIAFQVFVIIGGVTKMIPLTGITLPFVSYGGSSMLLNFASLGVLQKISESGRRRV